jgi:SAM-dependent methyltransferase
MSLRACRACGHTDLQPVLDLGQTPLANALLLKEQLQEKEALYPLAVVRCAGCSLVQLTETISPELLFRDYVYFSSFSETMLRHAEEQARAIVAARSLGADSLVVEIASNDGYFLRHFQAAGIPVLGIEPARNIARAARAIGIETVDEFFSAALAERLAADGRRADVILANNVMAHVPDIGGVLDGIERLLKPDGVFVMETPYLRDLVERLEFDTIYHEHLFYYSLTALERLLRRHGLATIAVEHLAIHGGSLRVTAARGGTAAAAPSVREWLAVEETWGVTRTEPYEAFSRRTATLRERLRETLGALKDAGHRLAAYGASAKGTTLLAYCGIGAETLAYVVDRSTAKQGRFTPGTRLPIHPAEHLLEDRPDEVLLLTWNFADEILRQQAKYREQGGRFIIPVPEPQVV